MTKNNTSPFVRVARENVAEIVANLVHRGCAFVPEETDVHWTARAIWNENSKGFDMLPDRQFASMRIVRTKTGKDARASEFAKGLGAAIKAMHKAFDRLGMDQRTDDYVFGRHGDFHMLGSPNASYGYAYLAAWFEPDATKGGEE